jgi:polysaccharide pyruvyl transferase WcaK-like protein
MKIGIVTYTNAINNGAILQAKGLYKKLEKEFPKAKIEFINHYSLNMEIYELLKCSKLFSKKIFFNLRRYLIFKLFISKFLKLSRKRYFGSYKTIVKKINENYNSNDLIICGSDSIWKLSKSKLLPPFPNIYWLSNKIKAKKISYAASAYQYDKKIFLKEKNNIKRILNSYKLISVRDSDTLNMVTSLNLNKNIYKVPDPAFFYEIQKTKASKKLINKGIDLKKPILALITNNKDIEIKNVIKYFKSKDFQIIGLSMYSSLVDYNLGDELNPAEWAEVFKYVSFCITDRFHGAIFCMRNKTPFIALEIGNLDKSRSKKYQLLSDFGILDCYYRLNSNNGSLVQTSEQVIKDWSKHVKSIKNNLQKQYSIADKFFNKIKEVIKND